MNKIKELRTEKGLTQSQLGAYLGVNQTAIGKYERGELEPNHQNLINLANLFECSIDYLIGRSDDFGNINVPSGAREQLTQEEQTLLDGFRSLPRQERAQAIEYVEYLADKRGSKNKHA